MYFSHLIAYVTSFLKFFYFLGLILALQSFFMATTDHFPATHNETSSFPTPSASRFTRIARFFFVNIIILAVICFTIFVSIILASGEDDTSARLNDNLYHLKDQSRMLLPQRIDKLR